MAGSNLNWHQIRADFNDANSAMRNAQSGFSQAGTVFGQLRKSILDEEQRAVENAYKEKIFDENVRQFGLKHALDRERFGEATRQFGLSHGETVRHNKASEEIQSSLRKLQQAEFDYKVKQEEQNRQDVKDYFNWRKNTQEAYDTAVKNSNKNRETYYKQHNLTDTDINNLNKYLGDVNTALAKNQEERAKLEQSKPSTTDDSSVSYDDDTDDMGYNVLNVYDPTSVKIPLARSHQTPQEARLNELAQERTVLEQQKQATTASLQNIMNQRSQYLADNPAPINTLPQDHLSSAMQFMHMTGRDPSKMFLGAVALQAMQNTNAQLVAQRKHEQAVEIANLTGEYKLRAAKAGKEDKKGDSVGWFKEHKVDERYAGVADALASELRTIAKARNKNIDMDVIRRMVLTTMFDKSSMSQLPGTNIVLKPKGVLGSYSDLDGALNFLQTGQGSSKDAVELLEKLGLLE